MNNSVVFQLVYHSIFVGFKVVFLPSLGLNTDTVHNHQIEMLRKRSAV